MAENAKLVLWQNVQALMSRAYGGESLGRFAADCGIGVATMLAAELEHRIRRKPTDSLM